MIATLSAVELVGVAEVATMLGLTRQRVNQLSRQEGFPEPLAVLSAGKVWKRADIEKWAKRTGRMP